MKFFKTFLAAFLAVLVGSFFLWIMMIAMISGISASFGKKEFAVMPNSVLTIDLTSSVVDSPGAKKTELDFANFSSTPSNSILEVLRALEYAATDNHIKGIYLNINGNGDIGISHVEEIRSALEKFKESGKFIIAYNENYSQLSYYLSSVADSVYMHPEGYFDWRGLYSQIMFYKGLMDKLDIKAEILRHGTFKSAVEPYMSDKMSPANRKQTEVYVNSMWNVILESISASRGISKTDLQKYAETLAVESSYDAKKLSFVDEVYYEDQVINIISDLIGGGEEEIAFESKSGINQISLNQYITSRAFAGKRISKNKIAVIYADGAIVSGESNQENVGSATVANHLSKARKDPNVKAVVLRVNSPGGSALASDVMWREVELLREEKPVVVSMGDFAASGGYYISCNADVILANKSTITGSIGVFGLILNLEKAFKDKLGITVDGVSTAPYASMATNFSNMKPREREFLMSQVKRTYKTFVNNVAVGRNMTYESVDKIGEGRVWLGADAMEIGLIDGFGGLTEAITLAAGRAGVSEDFRVYEIIEEPNPLQAFMDVFTASNNVKLKNELGVAFQHYNYINRMVSEKEIQARMPYIIDFK